MAGVFVAVVVLGVALVLGVWELAVGVALLGLLGVWFALTEGL